MTSCVEENEINNNNNNSNTESQSIELTEPTQSEIHEAHTLALRGGCIDFTSCGCPCEVCCIPCSIM